MLRITNALFTEYAAHLNKRKVPQAYYAEYKKWLRYYLDFCHKLRGGPNVSGCSVTS